MAALGENHLKEAENFWQKNKRKNCNESNPTALTQK